MEDTSSAKFAINVTANVASTLVCCDVSAPRARRHRGGAAVTRYLSGVLTVIAAGVMLIAFALLTGRGSVDSVQGFTAQNPYLLPPAQANPYALPAAAQAGGPPNANVYANPYANPYMNPYAPSYSNPYTNAAVNPYDPALARFAPPRPVQVADVAPVPRQVSSTRRAAERPKRDWKKTAMVIGGTSAAGAGLGGLFGGKKGALIGAAIGGGASALYEATGK